ncbi:class I SAM-dependent methyltransferase [Rhodobacteraceae bacterium CCMM004]|nr:class I SAM-dependent methyltransferase [Rhodobacteraceae bacterium CCMM004]
MDADTYAVEAEIEADHWWFAGRRRLFLAEMTRGGIPREAEILDVGTSTGTNLRMLRDGGFTRVTGLDASRAAIDFAAAKGLGTVREGDICAMPFADGAFDLVLATDVIEHVDDDAAALAEIARVTRPGGAALITVPAFQSLWGLQDEVAQHKRRYRMAPLLARVRAGGLTPLRYYHFNYLLFAPIWAARQVLRRTRPRIKSENQINTPALNAVLGAVFRADVATAPRLRPPFGVSALVWAVRP